MKVLLVLVSLFWLRACAVPDTSYVLDGVPVVLERSVGPDQSNLALAVQLYREEARDRWMMSADEETQVWRSLREIRWTRRSVPSRAKYYIDTSSVQANWTGCVLDTPFYQALTTHYAERDLTEEEQMWAEDLEMKYGRVVCITAPSWQMPAF